MAHVTIPDQSRTIEDVPEIRAFLKQFQIEYENWPLEDRVSPEATPEEILSAYEPEINRLKERGGYITADVINVTPQTPGLDAMLAKFDKEHTHSEDEVRFIFKGRGIFHVNPEAGPVFAIHVAPGDLISVPAGIRHWFNLCEERTIRAVRLFQTQGGWTPFYLEDAVHGKYEPVCWGPNYLEGSRQPVLTPVIK